MAAAAAVAVPIPVTVVIVVVIVIVRAIAAALKVAPIALLGNDDPALVEALDQAEAAS